MTRPEYLRVGEDLDQIYYYYYYYYYIATTTNNNDLMSLSCHWIRKYHQTPYVNIYMYE